MIDGLAIRPFEMSDTNDARELIRTLAADLDEAFNISDDAFADNAAYMIDRPNEYAQFVAVSDLEASAPVISGFISMVFYRSFYHAKGAAVINELVVHPDYRRVGVGAQLIARAFAEARSRNMDEIEVGALKKNVGAIRFYKRNGFDEEYVLLGHVLEE